MVGYRVATTSILVLLSYSDVLPDALTDALFDALTDALPGVLLPNVLLPTYHHHNTGMVYGVYMCDPIQSIGECWGSVRCNTI